ncbi:MAG: MFS transporter [Actinomycetota bacterium]|nr:MFS transporter [Actinomycetota bacterium]
MTVGSERTTLRYRDLFRDSEFTGLWIADVLSLAGSYVAKLAIAALVFQRTGSPGLTAAAFAISFAPYLFSPVLATIADRFPRKQLLVASDLVRAGLVLLLLIPGLPLGVLLLLLFVVETVQIPFGAARLATLADVLDADRFPVGNAFVASTRQAVQVSGFLIGGAVVALTGARFALLLDSVTYVVSAVLIVMFVRSRPQAWLEQGEKPRMWASALEGLRIVTTTPGMKGWFWLLALGPGLIVIAEGLAVPFADELGGGAMLAGVIMGTAPLGNVVGFAIFGRLPLERQQQLIYPCALSAGALVCLSGLAGHLTSSVPLVVLTLTLSGGTLGYLTAIQSMVASVVPRAARGRVFGLGNAVMQIAQGFAVVIAGVIAEWGDVALALGVSGGVGVLAVALVAATRSRAAAKVD